MTTFPPTGRHISTDAPRYRVRLAGRRTAAEVVDPQHDRNPQPAGARHASRPHQLSGGPPRLAHDAVSVLAGRHLVTPQSGSWRSAAHLTETGHRKRLLDDRTMVVKLGKRPAGRVLDGRTWGTSSGDTLQRSTADNRAVIRPTHKQKGQAR